MVKKVILVIDKNDCKTVKDALYFNDEWISLCREGCFCMTHTLSNNKCGKCGAYKGDYDESIGRKTKKR